MRNEDRSIPTDTQASHDRDYRATESILREMETNRKRMAEQNEVDFQLLAEQSVDIICLVGLDLVMLYASPSCQHILGWTPEEMCGKGPDVFVFPEDLPIVGAAHERLMANGVDRSPSTIRMLKKDGTYTWIEVNARLAKDEETGEPKVIVLTMRNVAERKRREEELEALALRDGLTGLANRRLFDRVLGSEWSRTLREGTQLSLILLDIDHFKQLNDHYGHLLGDGCLRAVASATEGAVGRATDLVARYGGEEIAIILPGTDSAGAARVAENVRISIEALQFPHEGNQAGGGWVSASFGVATASVPHDEAMEMPESLLRAADRALYKAKRDGRNMVVATDLLSDPANDREMNPET